jgi:Protein of unknown function (DUF1194)
MLESSCRALVFPILVGLLAMPRAEAEPKLDLALVIAVDVSSSIVPAEQQLQRDGFVEAFRSPLVHQAIRRGNLGRIAVAYVEWAGKHDQKLVIPWTVMEGRQDAVAFADRLAAEPRRQGVFTSISGAIDFSVELLGQDAEAVRRVVDVAGDGPNNDGRLVSLARDAAVAKGITINGLPILQAGSASTSSIPALDLYYRACVIGGSDAFVVPVGEADHFPAMVRAKIVREIAGGSFEAQFIRTSVGDANCLIGEIRRREEEAWK